MKIRTGLMKMKINAKKI